MQGGAQPDLVIGADTVVEHGGLILEKPRDAAQAKEFLTRLSGEPSVRHRDRRVHCLTQPDLPDQWFSPFFGCLQRTTTFSLSMSILLLRSIAWRRLECKCRWRRAAVLSGVCSCSGEWHSVHTGVVLLLPKVQGEPTADCCTGHNCYTWSYNS